MGLDGFTLIAQAINFLILVWLLKRFLYGRIVRAMDEREATIARRLQEAAQQRAAAQQEAERFRAQTRELEQRRERILARAEEDAEAHRQALMDAARRDAESAHAEWLETLKRERQELLRDLRERVGQQVFALARHGLRELADVDLEEQILKVFTERFRALDPAAREAIAEAVRKSDREIDIRTAFPVAPQARERLSRFLRQHLDDTVDVRFTTVPELLCGIELRAQSHRFAWNLDAYLEGLETRVFETLDESAHEPGAP